MVTFALTENEKNIKRINRIYYNKDKLTHITLNRIDELPLYLRFRLKLAIKHGNYSKITVDKLSEIFLDTFIPYFIHKGCKIRHLSSTSKESSKSILRLCHYLHAYASLESILLDVERYKSNKQLQEMIYKYFKFKHCLDKTHYQRIDMWKKYGYLN